MGPQDKMVQRLDGRVDGKSKVWLSDYHQDGHYPAHVAPTGDLFCLPIFSFPIGLYRVDARSQAR